MLAWAQDLKFPLTAGSSLPVTWRRPELELPLGACVEDALVAACGPIEVYGFHALEALQAMVERRTPGVIAPQQPGLVSSEGTLCRHLSRANTSRAMIWNFCAHSTTPCGVG